MPPPDRAMRQTAMTPMISIVVPLYNEVDNVTPLLGEIADAMAGQASFELICVDDGSSDGSFEALCAARDARPWLRVVRLPRNQGQSAALVAGFRGARGDLVVTLDADLQNDPADIPRLLAALEDGAEGLGACDMVSGIRANRRDTWSRRWASRIANRVRNAVVGDRVQDVGCSLKAYRREFLVKLPPFNGLHRFLPALLEIQGARIREIPVHHRPRIHGVSKYSINNRLWRGLHDLVGVRWLQRRWVDPSLAEEDSTWKSPPSGSS
jgi:dolichol-phosphate mannosyltransferase